MTLVFITCNLIMTFGYLKGYVSQTTKLGALGLPAYRTFSLEELEVATNNFHTTAFMGEGSLGQVSNIVNIYMIFFTCSKFNESFSLMKS